MTTPLGTGFPDFARQASEAQVLEINDINVTDTGSHHYPARYVGNAKALQLWANAITGGMRIAVNFWGDQGEVTIMDEYVVHMRVNDVAKQPIPILGPYMNVDIQFDAAGVQTYTLQLWRTPGIARFAGNEGDISIISKDTSPIGAGTTVLSFDNQYVMEGPAVWSAGVSGGNWSASLNALDFHGTVTELDHCNNLSGFLQPRPIYLPPWHIRIDVANFAAGAQTFSAFCTRRHNE